MNEPSDPVEVARQAFLDRPKFTLRLHIFLSLVALGGAILLLPLPPALAVATLAGGSVVAWMLYHRTIGPIRRFRAHADRIAAGDHTPILPARPYRDEFTDLALALNRMILEIERRQDLDIKSQKLRSIGLLASGVAHELNNPLQNILLTAHGLLEEHATMPDEERFELLRDLVKECERACRIVGNLLDFARQSRRETEPVRIDDVLEKTVWLARNHLKGRDIRTEVKTARYLPQVTANRDQLVQVFLNLVMNASDVTAEGGKVEVSADRDVDPAFVAVRVADRGPGIPDHVLSHIFDPFFSTKPRGKGTGIGLAISQAIVRRHGGSIGVETKPGEGTVFTVRLPAVPLPPEKSDESST